MDLDLAKTRLVEERTRLEETASNLAGDLDIDESQQSSNGELGSLEQNHTADHASETFEREKDVTILESLQDRQAEVAAALQRVADGSYGKCQTCGEDIAPERLEAFPAARFCIKHAG